LLASSTRIRLIHHSGRLDTKKLRRQCEQLHQDDRLQPCR
jgi:hypothetical protein